MKKVLIISYYWPPAGGPGVQRWLKFVKFLPEFNIQPLVYIPDNPHYPLKDESLIHDVPSNLVLIRRPIWEPYTWANALSKKNQEHSAGFYEAVSEQNFKTKLSLFIRGNIFIPDARVFWVKPSIKFLANYLKENNIDTIISSGPPHSMHLIGLGLKKKIPSLKWIADFRDPWTNIYYYHSLKLTSWADRKHHELEKKVLQSADYILTVTHDYCENYKKITPKPVVCLTNGFDPDDQLINVKLDTKFSIAYIGAMFRERNPVILWEALSEIIAENDSFKQDFQLHFVGKKDDSVTHDLERCGLLPYLKDFGYQPHKKALQIQHQSQILLMVNTDHPEKKGNIPGKIFEYIAAQRPVIAFGPADSQIEHILIEAQAGKHFLFHEKELVKEHILILYKNYLAGNLSVESKNLGQYNRKNISEALAQIIHQL